MILLEIFIDYLMIAVAFGYMNHSQIEPEIPEHDSPTKKLLASVAVGLGWPIIYTLALAARCSFIRLPWTEISLTEDNSK